MAASQWTHEQKLIIKHWIKNVRKIQDEINYNTSKVKYVNANKICKRAIDSFYSDYDPHLYHRRKSLYDAYKIQITKKYEFVFELGEEFMTKKHRADNSYIYDLAFKQGWHGGATKGEYHPHPDIPYWRTPPEEINYRGNVVEPYSYWFNKPAVRSTSPYETIKKKWQLYLDNTYPKEELRIWQDAFLKYSK